MKRLILFLLMLLPAQLLAVPTWVSTSVGNNNGGGTGQYDLTHTVAAGTNRELIIGVLIATSGGTSVTSVTWDPPGANQGFTPITNLQNSSGSTFFKLTVLKLKNPTAGASKLIRVINSNTPASCAIAINYTDVDPTTDTGTAATGSGNNTTPTVTASAAVAADLTVDFMATGAVGVTHTVAGGQQQRYDEQGDAAASPVIKMSASEKAGASPTLSWTITTNPWLTIAVPLKAAAAGIKPPTFILEDE